MGVVRLFEGFDTVSNRARNHHILLSNYCKFNNHKSMINEQELLRVTNDHNSTMGAWEEV